ncbi:MAG: hypothetical protein DCC71_11475 [Proteobacteria bacterium]|nr:MAG: hypothetical protein DCC71_11475 [Pseudomonadota bacterium]
MSRSTALLLIAVALAAFGLHRALYLPGMLVGPPVPLLLIGFALQAVLGIAAGVATWRRAPWAPLAIALLGAAVAATALFEVILGVVALVGALGEALIAIVVALLLAAYVRRDGAARDAAS